MPAGKAGHCILKKPQGAEDGAVHPAKDKGHNCKASHDAEIQGKQGRNKLNPGQKTKIWLKRSRMVEKKGCCAHKDCDSKEDAYLFYHGQERRILM